MINATSIFTQQDKINLKLIEPILISQKNDLANQLRTTIFSLIFENAHTLHPRRLIKFDLEETDSFLQFISDYNMQRVIDFGKNRADEGLSIKLILSLRGFLNQYCVQLIDSQKRELQQITLKAVDIYTAAYLEGFSIRSKEQTLKQQKELRQALSTALEGQRRELLIQKHAMNTSINAIVLSDFEDNITYVNPAFLNLWGYSKIDDVIGRSIFDLINSSDIKKTFLELHNTGSWHGELQVQKKDGKHFDVEMLASIIKDEKDNAVGTMTFFIDITQRKRLEVQSRHAQKMEALGQLASGLSHDFNNLLSAMQGYLQLILVDIDEDSLLYKDVMQIKIAIDRGTGLTKRLRYFAREASGDREPLNLNEIISETYELIKHTFPPEIAIELQLQSNLWIIDADPSQLGQVLLNLCVNARDAILEKHIQSFSGSSILEFKKETIVIETKNIKLDEKSADCFLKAKPGKHVRLRVVDSGIGMTNEILERLFEPFFSTKKSKQGTGLGLYIIYGIIERHGGFIDVCSEKGQGSTFGIYFPVSTSKAKKSKAEKKIPTMTSRNETVLVVDDETQLRDVMIRLLERCGYNVLAAENGINAISIFSDQQDNIDLVILDMIMPEMGGKECFHRLREINPGIKVLLNTGFTADDSAHEMLKDGVIDVVEKPFDIYKLSRAVEKALHRK